VGPLLVVRTTASVYHPIFPRRIENRCVPSVRQCRARTCAVLCGPRPDIEPRRDEYERFEVVRSDFEHPVAGGGGVGIDHDGHARLGPGHRGTLAAAGDQAKAAAPARTSEASPADATARTVAPGVAILDLDSRRGFLGLPTASLWPRS